jgi:hypothetical protein
MEMFQTKGAEAKIGIRGDGSLGELCLGFRARVAYKIDAEEILRRGV